jgi:hypothetical protein
MLASNSFRTVDLGILMNFRIYRFLLEKSRFFCEGRGWSFLWKTIIDLNSKVMWLHPLISTVQEVDGESQSRDLLWANPDCTGVHWEKPRSIIEMKSMFGQSKSWMTARVASQHGRSVGVQQPSIQIRVIERHWIEVETNNHRIPLWNMRVISK